MSRKQADLIRILLTLPVASAEYFDVYTHLFVSHSIWYLLAISPNYIDKKHLREHIFPAFRNIHTI
jgi:hypothetical protein